MPKQITILEQPHLIYTNKLLDFGIMVVHKEDSSDLQCVSLDVAGCKVGTSTEKILIYFLSLFGKRTALTDSVSPQMLLQAARFAPPRYHVHHTNSFRGTTYSAIPSRSRTTIVVQSSVDLAT